MRLRLSILMMLGLTLGLPAADPLWQRYVSLNHDIHAKRQQISQLDQVITGLGVAIVTPELTRLRAAVTEAQQVVKAATSTGAFVQIAQETTAIHTARDQKIDAILRKQGDAFDRLLAQAQEIERSLQELTPKLGSLSPEQMRQYAQARQQQSTVASTIYHSRAEYFSVGGNEARNAYIKVSQARSRDKTIVAADRQLGEARKALRAAEAAAGRESPLTAAERQKEEALRAEVEPLLTQLSELTTQLNGEWTSFSVQYTQAPDKPNDKPRNWTATALIPKNCTQLKGAVIGKTSTTDPCVRSVLRAESFALLDIPGIQIMANPLHRELFTTTMAKLVEKTGRPELAHVPWLTAGCSASVLTARNIAVLYPERTIGVIHLAGGNLHHGREPGVKWSLAGIPFLAINGEKEWCGPEGGEHAGLRPEYGRLTQWVMIREQLLRFRAHAPDHLMSLIVIPGGDHAGWSYEISPLVAHFVQQVIKARVPEQPQPAQATVRCRPIDPTSGWLADADFCQPRHPPASVKNYAGDPTKAFWHLDQELAAGIEAYHRGRLQPDPTREHPVPADWPPAPAPRP